MERFIAIESLRGLTALYVFIGHLVLLNFRDTQKWSSIFLFGQEAVIIFFLVSGFVIMYSMESARDKSFSSYIGRRFFRIYPIFLLAIVFSYILTLNSSNLLGNLFMLQDFAQSKPGVLFNTFSGNAPLWSLSYEWWFYVMFFPLYTFVAARAQMLVITIVALIAIVAYNLFYFQPLLFLAYFPIWWSGGEIGRAVKRGEAIPFRRILASLGAVVALFAIFAFIEIRRTHQFAFGYHPILELRHAGAALAMVILLFAYQPISHWKLERILRPFAIIAPISYGVYAMHYPLLGNAYLADLPNAIKLPAIILIVFAIGWFAEIPYQQFVLRLRAAWRARQLAPRRAATPS